MTTAPLARTAAGGARPGSPPAWTPSAALSAAAPKVTPLQGMCIWSAVVVHRGGGKTPSEPAQSHLGGLQPCIRKEGGRGRQPGPAAGPAIQPAGPGLCACQAGVPSHHTPCLRCTQVGKATGTTARTSTSVLWAPLSLAATKSEPGKMLPPAALPTPARGLAPSTIARFVWPFAGF